MPLVWLSRLKGFRYVSRVYRPDLMLALCDRSVVCSYRHFFYGGAEGAPEQLAAKLRQRFPGLRVAGGYSPPFRPLTSQEDAQVVQMINEANPDVVWVLASAPPSKSTGW